MRNRYQKLHKNRYESFLILSRFAWIWCLSTNIVCYCREVAEDDRENKRLPLHAQPERFSLPSELAFPEASLALLICFESWLQYPVLSAVNILKIHCGRRATQHQKVLVFTWSYSNHYWLQTSLRYQKSQNYKQKNH